MDMSFSSHSQQRRRCGSISSQSATSTKTPTHPEELPSYYSPKCQKEHDGDDDSQSELPTEPDMSNSSCSTPINDCTIASDDMTHTFQETNKPKLTMTPEEENYFDVQWNEMQGIGDDGDGGVQKDSSEKPTTLATLSSILSFTGRRLVSIRSDRSSKVSDYSMNRSGSRSDSIKQEPIDPVASGVVLPPGSDDPPPPPQPPVPTDSCLKSRKSTMCLLLLILLLGVTIVLLVTLEVVGGGRNKSPLGPKDDDKDEQQNNNNNADSLTLPPLSFSTPSSAPQEVGQIPSPTISPSVQPLDPTGTTAPTTSISVDIPTLPELRFTPFAELSTGTSSMISKHIIGYVNETWDLPGSVNRGDINFPSEINATDVIDGPFWEGLSLATLLDTNFRVGSIITSLGITSEQWNCWVNHYQDFTWDGLREESEVKVTFGENGTVTMGGRDMIESIEALGWTEESWNTAERFNYFFPQDPTSRGERPLWEDLTKREQDAATNFCWNRELWNRIPLPEWESM